jgi:hypothetical protein
MKVHNEDKKDFSPAGCFYLLTSLSILIAFQNRDGDLYLYRAGIRYCGASGG